MRQRARKSASGSRLALDQFTFPTALASVQKTRMRQRQFPRILGASASEPLFEQAVSRAAG
jgi:hypothetical protein